MIGQEALGDVERSRFCRIAATLTRGWEDRWRILVAKSRQFSSLHRNRCFAKFDRTPNHV